MRKIYHLEPSNTESIKIKREQTFTSELRYQKQTINYKSYFLTFYSLARGFLIFILFYDTIFQKYEINITYITITFFCL